VWSIEVEAGVSGTIIGIGEDVELAPVLEISLGEYSSIKHRQRDSFRVEVLAR